MLDRCCSNALLQGGGKGFNDHDGFGTGVFELVLQFSCGVQGVDIHHHQPGQQDARHCHRVLRHVEHHDGHPVTLDQTQTLQVGGKCLAQTVGLGEADVLAHETVGCFAGVLAEALLHQINQ